MENIQFQKHILERVQKLEEKSFGGTQEQNYSPREQAERITDDITDARHIGKKSPLVLKQELVSHTQNYAETMTKQEKGDWLKKKQSLEFQLREATK